MLSLSILRKSVTRWTNRLRSGQISCDLNFGERRASNARKTIKATDVDTGNNR